MFIPAISFSFGHRQVSPQSGVQQPKNDVQGLAQGLKAGGLAAAQKSFAAVQQGLQSVQSAQQSNQTTDSTNSTNPISTDIQGLSQSLSSGNLTGAQKALAALQQDLQTAQASYGHQHHQQAVGASQAASLYANNGNSTSNTAVSSLLSAANAINVSA